MCSGYFRAKKKTMIKKKETPHKDNSSNNNNSNSFDMESSIRKEDYHIDKYTMLHLLEALFLVLPII